MLARQTVWMQLLIVLVWAYLLSVVPVALMLGWHQRLAAHLTRWRLWWAGRAARREPARAALMHEFARWDEARREREAGQPRLRVEQPRSRPPQLALPPGRPR
jgi:hypothetical protein